MKKLFLVVLPLLAWQVLNAQCAFSGFVETGTGLYSPGCTNSTINVGTNSAIRMSVTGGVWYDFNTCGSGYDTQLTGYTTGGGFQFYNDDACGLQSAIIWQAGFTGELRVQNNLFSCVTTAGSGGSATLTYRIQPPTVGSPSTTQVNFCNSGGNYAAVTANSTQYGTVEWNFGNNSGGWSGVWTTGTSSGTCCFPKKTSNSDTNADRIRYRVNNGGCYSVFSPTILITNRWNEDPTSLSISNANYCTTTNPGSITLTANFPTNVNMNGTVAFFSGSCGGTLVATVNPGALSSTVSATITAPSSSTTYYARYQPGTGTSCGNSPCVSATVNVYAPPSTGTYAVSTYYSCGSAGNIYTSTGATVNNSVSGSSGSIAWQWGSSNGNWNAWGSGTSAPSSCCFPLNPSPTQADRMRAVATNAGCTVTGATVLVISDVMTPPTSASSSASTVCNGSPASITLSYSGGSTGVLGIARWYTASCGGTLIGTGNNLSITSPSVSTSYYVRFENPCTQTSCVSVLVSVQSVVLSAETYDLTCFESGDGAIDLSVLQTPPTFNSSLKQWTTASLGVITNTSNDVVQWSDLSGNNNHYVTNFGSGIKLQASSINGQPAIRFNASGIMESPGFATNPYTMIVVGKMNGGVSSRLVSSGTTNWLFGWWGGNRDAMYADGWVSVPGGTAGAITNPYIYSVSGNGSATSFYRNGGLIASNANGVSAPGIISLGGWGTGNTEQSNGDVAEVLVYNRVLDNAERQEVENYLNLKYAVSVPSGTETYAWSPGNATTQDLSALDIGTYSVTVTKNGCAKTLSGLEVNERQDIVITPAVTNEVCPSDNNGAIQAGATYDDSALPSAHSGLLIWTKADAGVVKNLANEVVLWKDLSGNNNHFQTTFGDNVLEVGGAIGGKPAIRFDANNIMETPEVINGNFTVIVIGKLNGGANFRLVSSGAQNWLLGWHNGARQKFYSQGWVYNPPTTTDLTTPYIYSCTGDLGADDYALYENGVYLTNNNLGAGPPGSLSLGGWGFNNSERSIGDVAEVIVYNRVLSSDERLSVERYLSNKYSISTNTGVDATYSWSNGSTVYNPSGLDAGEYIVTVTDVAGCTKQDTMTVGTDKTESVEATSASSSNNPICLGSSTTLSIVGGTAGTGAIWSWYTGSCGGTLVGTGASISVSPTVSTTYYVRASGDCNTTNCKSVLVTVTSAASNVVLVPSTTVTASEVCIESPWTYYANPATPNEYIFAIKKNGNTFVADISITDIPGTAPIESLGGQPNVRGTWLISRYWNVTLSSGSISSPVDIRFFIDDAELTQALADATTFAAANPWPSIPVAVTPLTWFKTNGAPFNPSVDLVNGNFTFTPTYLGYATGTTNGVTYYELQGLTSFSGGTGGFSVNDNGAPLPVELLGFYAKVIDNEYVQLNWSTATEINNAGFELMRSTDGIHFETIAWIDGNGSSNEIHNYGYSDFEVSKGITYYYQLKQVDFNGESELFDIKSVKLDDEQYFQIGNLVPNPSHENELVGIDLNLSVSQSVQVTIYNHMGMKVGSFAEQLNAGRNKLSISLVDLSGGAYFVNFEGAFGKATKKLVIVK